MEEEQLELFESLNIRDEDKINIHDYVVIKNPHLKGNVTPIFKSEQGYVKHIEIVDGERLCHVFFGNKTMTLFAYNLTKILR